MMIHVESESLAQLGYDVERLHLFVRFEGDKALFRYERVPPAVWEALIEAPSKGGYFNRFVRNEYEWTRVKDLCP